MNYKHKDKWLLQHLERFDVTPFMKTCLYDVPKYKDKRFFKVTEECEADEIRKFVSDPKNTTFKSIRDILTGLPHWNRQDVTYVPSNIKGYIFYFVCNECGRRAKYLYRFSMTASPLCRRCMCLDYKRAKKPPKPP